jgi:hypothetical protein
MAKPAYGMHGKRREEKSFESIIEERHEVRGREGSLLNLTSLYSYSPKVLIP